MPIKLSQLAAQSASLTLTFDDGSFLELEYYPNRITDEMIMKWQEAQNKGDHATAEYIRENNEAFLAFIKSWDMLEDDEVNFIPLTPESMIKVPVIIKKYILEAVMGEMQTGEVGKPKVKKKR
jgi:hypothetical protein